jgi:hypothetical protein
MNNCRDHGKFLWNQSWRTMLVFFLGNTLITSLQDQIGLLEYQNSEHFAGIVGKSSAGWVTKGLSWNRSPQIIMVGHSFHHQKLTILGYTSDTSSFGQTQIVMINYCSYMYLTISPLNPIESRWILLSTYCLSHLWLKITIQSHISSSCSHKIPISFLLMVSSPLYLKIP